VIGSKNESKFAQIEIRQAKEWAHSICESINEHTTKSAEESNELRSKLKEKTEELEDAQRTTEEFKKMLKLLTNTIKWHKQEEEVDLVVT